MKISHRNRTIGELEDGVLTKKGRQVMMFYKHNGFGMSDSVFNQHPVEVVRVHYRGDVYEAGRDDFLTRGIAHNYQGDAQHILPLPFWNKIDSNQLKLELV